MAETRKRDRGGAARLVPLPPPRPVRARPLHRRRPCPLLARRRVDLRPGRPRHLDDAGPHRHRAHRLPHARGPHLPPRRARPRLGLRRDRAPRRRPALRRRHRRHRLHALGLRAARLPAAARAQLEARRGGAARHLRPAAQCRRPHRRPRLLRPARPSRQDADRPRPARPRRPAPRSATPRARSPPWSAAAARR